MKRLLCAVLWVVFGFVFLLPYTVRAQYPRVEEASYRYILEFEEDVVPLGLKIPTFSSGGRSLKPCPGTHNNFSFECYIPQVQRGPIRAVPMHDGSGRIILKRRVWGTP